LTDHQAELALALAAYLFWLFSIPFHFVQKKSALLKSGNAAIVRTPSRGDG
jgi:hypothetical protein